MSDDRTAAVAGLVALGVGALAVGKRRGKEPRDDDLEDDAVEVEING